MFSCIWCDQEFESADKVQVHVRQFHQFNCNSCVREIKTWIDFVIYAQDCQESLEYLLQK